MDEICPVVRREWRSAHQHFVQHHAERIEVRAQIKRPVHPAGLLGRDVGQGPF
jgi:hypothetical protein